MHALSSFQRTKDYAFRPPTDASSNLLDFAPALFRGTLRIYDDLPIRVNPFFRYCEKTFGGDLLRRRNALDREHRVNRVL